MKLSTIIKMSLLLAGLAASSFAAKTPVDTIPFERYLTNFSLIPQTGTISFYDEFFPDQIANRHYTFKFYDRSAQTGMYSYLVDRNTYYDYGNLATGKESSIKFELSKPASASLWDKSNTGYHYLDVSAYLDTLCSMNKKDVRLVLNDVAFISEMGGIQVRYYTMSDVYGEESINYFDFSLTPEICANTNYNRKCADDESVEEVFDDFKESLSIRNQNGDVSFNVYDRIASIEKVTGFYDVADATLEGPDHSIVANSLSAVKNYELQWDGVYTLHLKLVRTAPAGNLCSFGYAHSLLDDASKFNLIINDEASVFGSDAYYSLNSENLYVDVDYVFIPKKEKYTVFFKDEGGQVLTTKDYLKGEIPVPPTLRGDNEKWHYFAKCEPEIVAVTENASYTVFLDSVLKDNSLYVTVSNVVDGEHVVVKSPSKCVEVYASWIRNKTDNVTTGDLDGEDIGDKVTFVEGKVYWIALTTRLDVTSTECLDDLYIKSVLYYGRDVRVFINEEYSYEDILVSEGKFVTTGVDKTFTATARIDHGAIVVAFFNYDGTQIGESIEVQGGNKLDAPATNPTREGYVFDGWYVSDAADAAEYDFAQPVVADLNLYAKYSVARYTVTWIVEGEIVETDNDVVYGSKPKYDGETPTKAADDKYTYEFADWKADVEGWTAESVVKSDVKFTAQFKSTEISSSGSSSSVASSDSEGSSSSEIATNSSSSRNDTENSSSSSAKQSSSSSVKQSSSSAKPASSSSEAAKNSSSSRNDTEKSSSSSAKPNSSSSVKSSSSGKTDAIFAATQTPKFSLSVAGRSVQIAGARIGAAYAILDMQGRVITTGSVESANFSVALPRSGSYMVRVGSQIQRVNVR